MLFKALFIAVLIYFAFVAIRNLIHAIRVDSMAGRPRAQRRDFFQDVLRERERQYQQQARAAEVRPQPRTTRIEEVRPQPRAATPRADAETDVQDARWTDL